MNRISRLSTIASYLAIEDAHLELEKESSDIGIYMGLGGTQYRLEDTIDAIFSYIDTEIKESKYDSLTEKGYRALSPTWPFTILPNMGLCHIAIEHGICGTNLCFCNEMLSGGQAIGEAYEAIRQDKLKIVIAGGCDTLNSLYMISLSKKGFLIGKDEDHYEDFCPFDARRKGFILGEGAAVLILEELTHAQQRGAKIYAELVGYNMAFSPLDGSRESFEAYRGATIKCLEGLFSESQIEPKDVDYINADGKATFLSDKAETKALKEIFGSTIYNIPVSSTKPAIGHILSASSAAELIIGVLSIRENRIPPTLNYRIKDPNCDLDYVVEGMREKEVKTVLSLSLGISGDSIAFLIKEI